MNDAFHTIVMNRMLYLEEMGKLACTSKTVHNQLRSILKSRFAWFVRASSLPMMVWRERIQRSHKILLRACSMMSLVQDGQSLLTICCYHEQWNENSWKCINLEGMIKDKDAIRRTNDGHDVCKQFVSGYGNTRTIGFYSKNEMSQHTDFQRGSFVYIKLKITRWSSGWDGEDSYMLLASDNVSYCQCLHCVTEKRYPSKECPCSRCSDLVTGKKYVKSVTYEQIRKY